MTERNGGQIVKIGGIVQNAFMNVGFQVLPIVVAIACIPLGIRALGEPVFGLYSLCATILVLCNLASFGLAPAVTREVARRANDPRGTARVVSYSTALMLVLGLGLAAILFGIARMPELLVSQDDEAYRGLAAALFRTTGMIVPLAFLSIALRAALEGMHLFKFTALNRAILNSFLVGAPALSLYSAIDVITSLRVVGAAYGTSVVLLGILVMKRVSVRQARGPLSTDVLSELVRSGGWIGISSLLMISLVYVDRFIIARFGDLSEVTYYVAVFDLVTRLSIVSGSSTAVLFPAISYWNEMQQSREIVDSLLTIYKVIALVISLAVIGGIVFARDLLIIWLGAELAANSTILLQVISVGVLFNSLAAIPYRALLAVGHARFVAWIYLVMAVVHILATLWAVAKIGALGAALTYGLRAMSEALVLTWAISGGARGIVLPVNLVKVSLASVLTGLAIAVAFAVSAETIGTKMLVFAGAGLALTLTYQRFFVSRREKTYLASTLRRLAGA